MNNSSKSLPVKPSLFVPLYIAMSLLCLYLTSNFYHDDSMISLRYAYNWLNGGGITWNPGEYVEGYTNFLYVIAIAVLGYIGIDLRIASQVLGIVSYAALASIVIGFIWQYEKKQPSFSIAFTSTSFFLLSSLSLATWSWSGLEAVMVSAWVAAGVVSFLVFLDSKRNAYLLFSSLFFVLGSLTRLDAGIFPAITGCFMLALCLRGETRLKDVLIFAAPAIIYIPYFLWKWHYYGDILPNTFYAKAGSLTAARLTFGLAYVMSFVLSPPFIYLWIGVLGFRYRHKIDQKLSYLLILLVLHSVYVLYAGGDHMPVFRFFVPVLPAAFITLYFLLRFLLEDVKKQPTKLTRALIILSIVLQFVWPFHLVTPLTLPAKEDPAGYIGRLVGQYIEDNWSEGKLIALNTAGSTPYYAPRHLFLDMLGLNDPHIARKPIKINRNLKGQKLPGHNKGDGAYVLQRKPDYIIIGPSEGTDADNAWFLSGHELSLLPEFYQLYEKKTVSILVPSDGQHTGYNAITDGKMEFVYYQRRQSN